MGTPRKDALPILLYLLAGAIVVVLLVLEFQRDRFGDCMSIGAFSREACEEYARE